MSDALLTAIEHHRRGQLPQAEALYRQILARDPMNADALHLLGVIAHQVGQHAQAEQLIGQAIRLKPGAADFHSNLGETLRALGKLDVAIASYQRAIQLNPEHLDALINLGAALQSSGRTDEAIAAFERVVALRPDHADAWSNLGFALGVKNLAYPAEAACRRAIELNPNHARAHANLAAALQKQARAGEAVAAYRKAIDLEPAMRVAHGNLLLALNYDPAQTPQDVFAEHVRWAELHANVLGNDAPPHANDRDENRRLRIGYVSPDLRRHSVAFFVEPLLAAHDRAAVEIFCYSDAERPDDVTQRIRASADHWRECHGVVDDLFANIVRDDRIDILIDLAGHTGGNRLLAFARRSAPVQMTYLGYPNTTGLAAMDFRITDAWADPPGSTDAFHTEQLIRLPRTAWCYQPSREAPPVAPLPVESAGHITFASFNKLAKISPLCLDTWAQLLRRIPDARMIIKATALLDPIARQRMNDAFAAREVDPARLHVLGPLATAAEHLSIYARADVALDTFPYHGTTTTCDALYMGVPVVTLAGQTHVSRVGVSLLHTVGLEHLVAQTPQQYVEIATRLSEDREPLSRLRAELRPRMQSSPLFDGRGLAGEMESAFRQAWQRWCSSGA